MKPQVRLLLTLSVAVLGISLGTSLASPPPAQACVWNVLHYFLPWPPCSVEDENVIHRTKQLNARLAATLFEVGYKIREVKIEIYQWQRAYQTATNYENKLKRVYGDLVANPLPSLVHTLDYSNITSYASLDSDGGFQLSLDILDIRAVADSIKQMFLDETNIQRMWTQSWSPTISRQGRRVERNAQAAQDQLISLGEYQEYSELVGDSLSNLGNRLADRYTNNSSAGGDAEAEISRLSAILGQLRGTSFETQALGITNRIRALELAAEKEELLSRRSGTRATLMVH